MLKYAMQARKMNEIMELLFHVLDVRITFFDLQECEVEGFQIKEMSDFCRYQRRNAEFDAHCRICDQEHLRIAKQNKAVHIYHCHAGLLEGIVPLYDRRKNYLGAIVFGQLHDPEMEYGKLSKTDKRLLMRLRASTRRGMHDTGVLLKYLSEYIIENELIKYNSKPWVERLDNYINDHIAKRLKIGELAEVIGRSTSFVSHNFPKEFGVSLKEYILGKRMRLAKERLESGETVRQVAYALGFYDEFHFSKEFKRFFGTPPSQFKR